MTARVFHSDSPVQTLQAARQWAKTLSGGTAVGLQGELGAGKTLFAKGVIQELSGEDWEEITSPTFTLIEEYPGEPFLYHVDLYRLEKAEEIMDLPWDDLLAPGAVTLVEWPERSQEILQYCHYLLKFSKEGELQRRIEISERRDLDL